MQKTRNSAFYELRRSGNLQHAGVAGSKLLRPFIEHSGLAQEHAALIEQLLTFAGQDQATPHTIEKLETELLLDRADLTGQSRLGSSQAQCRLGDGAELGHGDEGSRVSQLHNPNLCRIGIDASRTMYWTSALAHIMTGASGVAPG